MVYLTSDPNHVDISVLDTKSSLRLADYRTGMMFEDSTCKETVLSPTRMVCPFEKCSSILQNKQDLRRHVNSVHDRLLCDICLNHKKAFSFEYEIFENKAALLLHQKNVSGHPMCKICKSCFYSEDELITHCREKHEACHICQNRKRRLLNQQDKRYITPAVFDQDHYFSDYASLEEHFKRDHFMCTDPICLESKFIVFENEIELKAHSAEVHLDRKLQRSRLRQLQRIDVPFSQPSSAKNILARRTEHRGSKSQEVPNEEAESPRSQAVEPPPRDNSNFFFPLASSTQQQTWELFETRNLELATFLEKLNFSSDDVKSRCRKFQQNQMVARELTANLYRVFGPEQFQKILPRLIELEDNSIKRAELCSCFKEQVDKILAFPSLPSRQAPPSSSSYYSTLITGEKRNIPLFKGRILSKKTGIHSAPSDPCKNPLSLLPGVSFSQPKAPAVPKARQDFSQAVGGVSSRPKLSNVIPKSQQDFPSLSDRDTIQGLSPELEEDSFIIGGGHSSQETLPSTETSGTSTRKKKWKTVRHIGL